MANEMMCIFFPLKIVTYPDYGSDDFAEEISPAEAVAHEDAILAAIARRIGILKATAVLLSILTMRPSNKRSTACIHRWGSMDGELWSVMTT